MRLAANQTGAIHSMFLALWNMTDEALAAAANKLRAELEAETHQINRTVLKMSIATFTREIDRREKLRERASV
jgi:hypothetical protein